MRNGTTCGFDSKGCLAKLVSPSGGPLQKFLVINTYFALVLSGGTFWQSQIIRNIHYVSAPGAMFLSRGTIEN